MGQKVDILDSRSLYLFLYFVSFLWSINILVTAFTYLETGLTDAIISRLVYALLFPVGIIIGLLDLVNFINSLL